MTPEDLIADRTATWRVLGIDPEEAEKNNCWLAPSVLSALDDLARQHKRELQREVYAAMRVAQNLLPEKCRRVIQMAYDAVFDIIMNKPSSVEECVKRLTKVSPSLHEAINPSMHG